MEVHHHSHTARKKWTHYFWEFLMLFLAVFCGFLAEYQLEHKIERDRAREFARSLWSDLKVDTASLNNAISIGLKKVDAIDSLVVQLELPFEKWDSLLVYTYEGFASRVRPFVHNSGTYEQMKASGSLRYFKQSLSDQLNQYDMQAKKAKVREDILQHYSSDLLNPFIFQILDTRCVIQIQNEKPPTHPLIFRRTDPETIGLWINYATAVQSTQARTTIEYQVMLEKAGRILEELGSKYKLK